MFGPNIRTLSGRNVILAKCGSNEADDKLRKLFDNTACNFVEIPIIDHDKYMSISLGLSHAINLLFGLVITKSGYDFKVLHDFTSTTFLKQARTSIEVFSENPELYYSIQKFNSHKDELYNMLEEGIKELQEYIISENSENFENFVNKCKINLGIT